MNNNADNNKQELKRLGVEFCVLLTGVLFLALLPSPIQMVLVWLFGAAGYILVLKMLGGYLFRRFFDKPSSTDDDDVEKREGETNDSG